MHVTRRFGRLLLFVGATVLAATVLTMGASASAPPGPFFNGFENAADVGTTDQAMFSVSQVATGPSAITSASGSYHALADTGSGAFTRYGGYGSVFPASGYTTSADIYLDTSQSTSGADLRFDWDSAINDASGNFLRDFVFNVGTNGNGGFVMTGSNNAGRSGADPANPGRNPITISTSGWYTFQHHFYDNGGVLAADLTVRALHSTTVLGTWTLSDPTDLIGTVGGNRYGWLVNNELPLALDNITRSGVCTPTGLFRDGINLTASQINPTGTVSGPVYASGCNIGVYYGPGTSGSVTNAEIWGANYYGVVVNAAAVNTTNSSIHDIGQVPFNGTQHGVGVLYTTINQALGTTGPAATGTVSGNTIRLYQKNGVVVSGTGAVVTVQNDTVTGNGLVDYIAQNGIQMSYGATGTIYSNTVSDNEYTGTNFASSGGIIIVGGAFYFGLPYSTGISVTKNVVTNNDVGVWLSNAQADGSAPLTKTNNKVVNNTISKSNDATNISGDGTCGYQAGIADEGNKDSVVNNTISGNGYLPATDCASGTFRTAIDPLGNNHINNN
jgi:hypothetical protein